MGQGLAVPGANPAAIITPSQTAPSPSTLPSGTATLPPSGGIADSSANSAPTPPTDAPPPPTHHSAQGLASDQLGLSVPMNSAYLPTSIQPSTERRRKFAVQQTPNGDGTGGPSAADGSRSAGGATAAQLGGHVLPPGYLPFAAIAPGTQPTNDGHSDFDAGFAEGHAKAVAAMSNRLEWLSHEWRAQQSVVQQIFVQARRRPWLRAVAGTPTIPNTRTPTPHPHPPAISTSPVSRCTYRPTRSTRHMHGLMISPCSPNYPSHFLWQAGNVPGVREAAALGAQLAASQPAQLMSPQPGSASALSRSRRPSAGNVVNPEHTGSVAPPAQAGGEAWVANGAAKAGGAGEERPPAVLTQLQLEMSELLAANQRLRQENMEMLREIFPCDPPTPPPAG